MASVRVNDQMNSWWDSTHEPWLHGFLLALRGTDYPAIQTLLSDTVTGPKGKEPCKVSNSHQGPIANISYIRSSQNDVCSTVTRRGVKTRLSRPPFHRLHCRSDL